MKPVLMNTDDFMAATGAQHTPGHGSWRVFDQYADAEIRDERGYTVAVVRAGTFDSGGVAMRRRAAQIAATPELLAALQGLQELTELLAANCADRVDVSHDPRIGAARAAIAKATGGAA